MARDRQASLRHCSSQRRGFVAGLSTRRLNQQRRYTDRQSPVDVIIGLRKELAEFQKVSNKQAFKETLRAALRAACKEALLRAAAGADRPDYPNIEPIVEYLTERGLIRPKLSRARIRRLKLSLASSERSGPATVRADQGAAAHGIPDCLSGGTEVTVLAARSANFVRLAVEEPRS